MVFLETVHSGIYFKAEWYFKRFHERSHWSILQKLSTYLLQTINAL